MSKFHTTRRRIILAAFASGTLLTAGVAPASAQFYFFGGPFYRPFAYRPPVYQPPVLEEELSPRQLLGLLHRQGFRNVSKITYREDAAFAVATDPHGHRLRLTVDVFTGRIINAAAAPQERQRLAERAPAPRQAPSVRREPVSPQPPREAAPKPAPAPRPPTAKIEPQPTAPGTRTQPRRIDGVPPPATLDDVRPTAPAAPAGPPINSVPPAALE